MYNSIKKVNVLLSLEYKYYGNPLQRNWARDEVI